MASFKIIEGKPVDPQAKLLVVRFKSMKPVETIEHDEIAVIIGEKYGTARYRTVFAKARQLFFSETGVYLVNLPAVGYQYPVGKDQMRTGIHRTRSGIKSIRKGTEILGSVSDDRLNEPERKARDFATQRSKELFDYAKQQARQIQMTVGKTKTLPMD